MTNIDNLLYHQLIIARLGEKELMNWWNTDIAYEMGGAAFLKDLLGETMAPLAAGEAILKAARGKEETLLKGLPNRQHSYFLFHPHPGLQTQLEERLRHFKRYPEDVHVEIKTVLDPKQDYTGKDLSGMMAEQAVPEMRDSSFGKEITIQNASDSVDIYVAMAKAVSLCERNSFILHFFRDDNDEGRE